MYRNKEKVEYLDKGSDHYQRGEHKLVHDNTYNSDAETYEPRNRPFLGKEVFYTAEAMRDIKRKKNIIEKYRLLR